ncbi:MAG: ATP-binding cassette domain-containing protein [Cumulibacter sp.]
MDLEANRIHGLLGRNGAGKTTLLSSLASLRQPDEGVIEIGGINPFENESAMEQVCLIRESGDVFEDQKLSVNLDWIEMARPHFDRAYAERLIDEFGLTLKSKPNKLSRGQSSAFGVAIGLATRAEVTMFDEVHLGMDAPARQMFYDELLRDFAEHPRTFLMSTHLINEVEHLLETATILDQGSVLLSEEADLVRQRGATIVGAADAVAAVTADLPVIGTRDLGPTRETVVYGTLNESALNDAARHGLQISGVPLQELFTHLTTRSPAIRSEAP